MEAAGARIAVLSIAADVAMESLVADQAMAAGHVIAAFDAVRDAETAIRAQLQGWIEDPAIDVVIVVGKGEATRRAVQPMVEQVVAGFEDLAVAVRCGTTRVFALPAGEAAARAALERVLAARPRADTDTNVDIRVPSEIPPEKTVSGAGLVPRLPAAVQRSKSRTGANVVERKVEDPTRPIELDKLEQQLELSQPRDEGTKPIELAKLETQLALSAVEDATKRVVPATTPRPADPTRPVELAMPLPRLIEPARSRKPAGPSTPTAAQPVVPGAPAAKPAKVVEPAAARPQPAKPPAAQPIKPAVAVTPLAAKPIKPAAAKPAEPVAARPAEPARPGPATRPPQPAAGRALASSANEPVVPHPDDEPAIELTTRKPRRDVAAPAELARLPVRPPGAEAELELDERDLVAAADPAPAPAPISAPEPVRAARTRPPTPPPPPTAARSSVLAGIPEPAAVPAMLADLPLPPPATSSVLDAGSDATGYPTLRRSKAPVVIALVLLLAIAGGVVWYTTREDAPRTDVAQTTPSRAVDAEPVKPAPDAAIAVAAPTEPAEPIDAVVAVAEPPVDAEVAAPEPPVHVAVKAPVKRPPPPRRSARPQDKVADANPVESPAVDPTPKPVDAAPKDTPAPGPKAEPGCEEVTCVLEKYARPCCARFKPKDDAFAPAVGASDSLTKPQIRAGVGTVKGAVIACGERFPAKGTVRLAITVDADGHVQSAEVQATPDDALGNCAADVLRKARFAKTAEGGSFTYPFVF